VDEIRVTTEVHVAPGEAYEFLLDFPGYARYSKYLDSVRTLEGEGGPGTRYALRFSWWKLSYTARSEVTDVTPGERIDWRLTKDIDAHGAWIVDPLPTTDDDVDTPTASNDRATGDGESCRVTFEVYFDPGSARSGALDLPRFVSFDYVLGKAIPLVRGEAERVVERAVADLEGERRAVDLDVFVDSERI